MVKDTTETKVEDQKETTKLSYYEAVGRRKESSARVRLYVVGESPITVFGMSLNKGDMIMNKKPIVPTQNEIQMNRRARSAKLRAIKL